MLWLHAIQAALSPLNVLRLGPPGERSGRANPAYYGEVTTSKPLEDDRGVDVVRIRELLALTPAQRVAHMVDVVNVLRAVSDRARAARQ